MGRRGLPGRQLGPVPVLDAGIVIGSYGMPGAVELNIAAIRHTCGDVPILVYDDATPCQEGGQRIQTIPDRYSGVNLYISPQNHGHANGDLQAFRRGLEWASVRGLRRLVKFSQRFIITDQGWLRNDGDRMAGLGYDVYSQPAYHLNLYFRMRTECVMMDVGRCWPMVELLKNPVGCSAEDAVSNYADQLGLNVGRWARIPPDRFARQPGILWHNANSDDNYENPSPEYRELAERLDVDLGSEFSGAGWHVIATRRPGTQYRML